jgi:hypothetical protein
MMHLAWNKTRLVNNSFESNGVTFCLGVLFAVGSIPPDVGMHTTVKLAFQGMSIQRIFRNEKIH